MEQNLVHLFAQFARFLRYGDHLLFAATSSELWKTHRLWLARRVRVGRLWLYDADETFYHVLMGAPQETYRANWRTNVALATLAAALASNSRTVIMAHNPFKWKLFSIIKLANVVDNFREKPHIVEESLYIDNRVLLTHAARDNYHDFEADRVWYMCNSGDTISFLAKKVRAKCTNISRVMRALDRPYGARGNTEFKYCLENHNKNRTIRECLRRIIEHERRVLVAVDSYNYKICDNLIPGAKMWRLSNIDWAEYEHRGGIIFVDLHINSVQVPCFVGQVVWQAGLNNAGSDQQPTLRKFCQKFGITNVTVFGNLFDLMYFRMRPMGHSDEVIRRASGMMRYLETEGYEPMSAPDEVLQRCLDVAQSRDMEAVEKAWIKLVSETPLCEPEYYFSHDVINKIMFGAKK